MANEKISDLDPWKSNSPALTDLLEFARAAVASFKGSVADLFSMRLPPDQYAANTSTAGFTMLGTEAAGADDVVLVLTGTLGAGANAQLPNAVDIVAAIPGAYIGQKYRLRIINRSSAAFTWTVTVGTNDTITGTATVDQNTYRDFIVTLTDLTHVALQSLGQVAIAA